MAAEPSFGKRLGTFEFDYMTRTSWTRITNVVDSAVDARKRYNGEISEASFRAWLRRVLGLEVKKERRS